MKKEIFLLLLSLVTVISACVRSAEETKPPNIIFYLSDDQDKYDYGCYGNDLIQTPSVDQLAREGMVFENAFTGQAICAPSRSQLYTGNYPLRNGCFMNHTRVKGDLISVTKYMRDLGYEVILAGKSHVKPKGVFDWDREWKTVQIEGAPREYIPMDSIRNYFENADRPFCMFITSAFPHGPYYDVEGGSEEDIWFYPFNSNRQHDPEFIKHKAGYYRSVEEDNVQLGKVLQWVDEYLGENNLFIYSADHGVSGKFGVYDRGLNVPFVARWPGVVEAGSRSGVLVHYTDVLPTFIEVAGGMAPENMDGRSLLKTLEGDMSEIHDFVYGVQTNQNILRAKVFPSRMVRSKQYKYIRNYNSAEVMEYNFGDNKYVNAFIRLGALKYKNIPFEELYDIQNDPFEQHNLAGDPGYQDIKKAMASEMFDWMKAQGDFLSDTIGYMPILQANYKLDVATKYNQVADTLENSLKEEDYLYCKHLK